MLGEVEMERMSEKDVKAFEASAEVRRPGNYVDLLNELSNQYLIGYSSSNSSRDETYRRIRVDVDGHHEVRARQGYRVQGTK